MKTIKFSKDRLQTNVKNLSMAAELIHHSIEDLKNDADMNRDDLENLREMKSQLEEISGMIQALSLKRS